MTVKRGLLAAFLILLCSLLVGCTDCAMQYEYAELGNFEIGVNKLKNICFVGSYRPPLNAETNVIEVPNDYNGIPITRVGGYTGLGVPTPFMIDMSEHYPVDPNDENTAETNRYPGDLSDFSFDFEYDVVEVEFLLRFGANIEEIVYVEMDTAYLVVDEDGYIFYRPVVYIECAENNPVFYSEDGKLYRKETNTLVEEFCYKSE